MYVIEIVEDDFKSLTEHISKGLKYLGKAMECLDKIEKHSQANEREDDYDDEDDYRENERYGNRGKYSDNHMNGRNNRSGGRYSRY